VEQQLPSATALLTPKCCLVIGIATPNHSYVMKCDIVLNN